MVNLKFEKRVRFFEKEVFRFLKMFNLMNYDVSVDAQIKESALASCYADSTNNKVNICYSQDWLWNNNTTNKEITKTAFHEVMELFLIRLRDFSENVSMPRTPDCVDREVHNIIRVLENIVLPVLPLK